MTNGKNKQAELIFPIMISVALASLIHLLVLLRGFYSATLDESGRTLDAYNWIRGNEQLATVWLPFYKILVGGALVLNPDLFVTPRVVSFLFGTMALCALIWFSHVLFNNRMTTLYTGLLGAIFPPRVVLSVVPLAEIMFIAFVILAMSFLAHWLGSGRYQHGLLAAACFAVGSSVRYEGWMFVGVFVACVMLLLLMPANGPLLTIKRSIALVLTSVSFVATWLILHLVQHGNAFGFLSDTTGRYALIHGDSRIELFRNNPLSQFVLQNVWTVNLIGFLALPAFVKQSFHNKILVFLPTIALVLVSIVAFLGKGMPTHGFWRIPALWSILLLPFTAHWFAKKLGPSPASGTLRKIGITFLLSGLLVSCLYGVFSMTERSAFSKDDLAMGRYINGQISGPADISTHKILIESGIWSYVNVMIASQHPEWFVYNTGFDPTRHEEPLLNPDTGFNKKQLEQIGIEFFVFRREDYKDLLDASIDVKKLTDFGPWTLYAFLPRTGSVKILL